MGDPSPLVGVISDTHGRVPAEVFRHFEGVTAILHAGDVGSGDVLIELGAIAPVHAVLGNVDGFEMTSMLPPRLVVELAGMRIGLAHGHLHGGPSERHLRLRQAFSRDDVDAVIYGHTHRACADRSAKPWVLNPGSATQGRGHGRTLALLQRVDGQIDFNVVELD